MSEWAWIYFSGLWLFCGYLGWRCVLHKNGGVQSRFDAFMIGPCMLGGPIVLAIAIRDFE